jgi:DegT/DnrJ/EryC1/StrS aminotransferase family
LVPQDLTQKLVATLLDTYGYPRGIAFGRAATGIALALRAWRGGAATLSVALPSIVCHDVLAAIIEAGCKPVFCDVNEADGLTPIEEWARALESGAKAVVMVHLFGNVADGEALRGLCTRRGALLIDDAAQALGSMRGGVLAGSFGDVGVLSFGATKHIEVGGAVLMFRDENLAQQVGDQLDWGIAANDEARLGALSSFRQGFVEARNALWNTSKDLSVAQSKFVGLLDGYGPAVFRAWNQDWAEPILDKIDSYPKAAAERSRKASLWERLLDNARIEPVGMGEGCIPWRYTIRLPGIDWALQHEIGQGVRDLGYDVSHWYLPANWFLVAAEAHVSPHATRLASEIFQLWVTPETSDEAIAGAADAFRRELDRCAARLEYRS